MVKVFVSLTLAIIVTIAIFITMTEMISMEEYAAENSELVPPLQRIDGSDTDFTVGAKPYIRTKDCSNEAVDGAILKVQKYRHCKRSEECVHTGYGFLDGIAINRQNRFFVDKIIEELKYHCGERMSHDAFYSDFGIRIGCNEGSGQCVVQEITKKMIFEEQKAKYKPVFQD